MNWMKQMIYFRVLKQVRSNWVKSRVKSGQVELSQMNWLTRLDSSQLIVQPRSSWVNWLTRLELTRDFLFLGYKLHKQIFTSKWLVLTLWYHCTLDSDSFKYHIALCNHISFLGIVHNFLCGLKLCGIMQGIWLRS